MEACWFPHLLLLLVEVEPGIEDQRRQQVASVLIGTDDCCLKGRTSDIAVKVKHMWGEELAEVSESGRCPSNLYSFMLGARAQMGMDAQDVEGDMPVLQHLGNNGRSLQLPTATHRMSLKLGRPVTPDECLQLHSKIDEHFEDPLYKCRFVPLMPYMLDWSEIPPKAAFVTCNHKRANIERFVPGYVCDIYKDLYVGASFAHWFVLGDGLDDLFRNGALAYLIGFTFARSMMRARCVIQFEHGRWECVRDAPLVREYLADVLSSVVRGHPDEDCHWVSCPVRWCYPKFRTGVLSVAE
eukprot:2474374-Pyramimonas_sp.AAC.2